MNETDILNVSSGSTDWRCYALSNFPCFPFELGGLMFASVEGFIQGIKFPETDPRRQEAFGSWGKRAKLLGESAERKYVWWKNDQNDYGSINHHTLIIWALTAKFHHNEGARFALKATGDLKLIHDVGPESPNTSFPAKLFCETLTALRKQLNEDGTI